MIAGAAAGERHQKALARLHSARVSQSSRRAALPRAAARSRPLQGTLSRLKQLKAWPLPLTGQEVRLQESW